MSIPGLVGASVYNPPLARLRSKSKSKAKPRPKPKAVVARATVPALAGRVWVSIPFDLKKNLGRAYNHEMRRIGEHDWMCFLDHDAMWTTRQWYQQLVSAATAHPSAGAFTAVTNRIGAGWQRVAGVDPNNHDMVYHRKIGAEQLALHGSGARDVTDNRPALSGVVIMISKAAWRQIGGFAPGFLGVDNRMHHELRQKGRRVYLLAGLYVYHWYRALGDTAHLAK